jgi:hypothetical protein
MVGWYPGGTAAERNSASDLQDAAQVPPTSKGSASLKAEYDLVMVRYVWLLELASGLPVVLVVVSGWASRLLAGFCRRRRAIEEHDGSHLDLCTCGQGDPLCRRRRSSGLSVPPSVALSSLHIIARRRATSLFLQFLPPPFWIPTNPRRGWSLYASFFSALAMVW